MRDTPAIVGFVGFVRRNERGYTGEGGRGDARTREAPGAAARTKRGTGRRSTSASTGWPNLGLLLCYSPKCVEGVFSEVELPLNGVLGSWRLPEELEEDDAYRYGEVEAVRRS